jgi:hypothetical protein
MWASIPFFYREMISLPTAKSLFPGQKKKKPPDIQRFSEALNFSFRELKSTERKDIGLSFGFGWLQWIWMASFGLDNVKLH